jgi:hypothetical protein
MQGRLILPVTLNEGQTHEPRIAIMLTPAWEAPQ